MSKKIVSLTLFSMFLLSAMVVTSVVAQPRVVGVDVGDWFKYGDITVSWSSNDPNATIPFNFEWMSALEWIEMTVTDVSSTNITFQSTWHLKNTTDGTHDDIVVVDINTGEGSPYGMWAISANLNANDTIYSSFDYSTMKINETIVRTYPDGVRDTNHLNNTVERSGAEFYEYNSTNTYWDRSCGILVESSYEQTSQKEGYTTISSMLFRITESNVWVVPEFPSFLILPIFMISTLLAYVFTILKRKKAHSYSKENWNENQCVGKLVKHRFLQSQSEQGDRRAVQAKSPKILRLHR